MQQGDNPTVNESRERECNKAITNSHVPLQIDVHAQVMMQPKEGVKQVRS